ncbi:hypothetical protein CYLTODRAFT_413123 [Cylindrobasidium torrendii FP15055 ss-10]|uniref:Uncharacterized protein n=1 Tax=Cylindrobasidium torrendii FP15055 ss-10 TaxID=1314674 RepID=A0A0D7B3F5_9AGAR|nr:hypothetical protein CYLTODRAFT_413123 [Cylindrobasidium torrendii FP15055 ss-10]
MPDHFLFRTPKSKFEHSSCSGIVPSELQPNQRFPNTCLSGSTYTHNDSVLSGSESAEKTRLAALVDNTYSFPAISVAPMHPASISLALSGLHRDLWESLLSVNLVLFTAMQSTFTFLGTRICDKLEPYGIMWTSVNPFAHANAGKPNLVGAVLGAAIVKNTLTNAGFPDVGAAFIESATTRSIGAEPLSVLSSVKTTNCASHSHQLSRIVSYAHVARPPPPIHAAKVGPVQPVSSQHCKKINAPGEESFQNAVFAMMSTIADQCSHLIKKATKEDQEEYKHPHDGLLQASDVVREDGIRNPEHLDDHGKKCLLVVKIGASTGTTVGRVNVLESFTTRWLATSWKN